MNDMNLACFMSVARTRNFSVSAKGLLVSQQFVSQNIKKLEDELGFPLLNRQVHAIELTQAGERFYQWCTDYSAALFQAGLPVRSSNDPEHRLAIGWSDWGGCNEHTQQIMRTFAARQAQVSVTYYQGGAAETLALLEHGLLDLAILPQACVHSSGMTSVTLYDQPLQLILASDDPMADDSVPTSVLLALPCARVSLNEEIGQTPPEFDALRQAGLPVPQQILKQECMDVLYSVVMDRAACAIVVPNDFIIHSEFVYCRALPGVSVPMAAVYATENASAQCRTLCEQLTDRGDAQ